MVFLKKIQNSPYVLLNLYGDIHSIAFAVYQRKKGAGGSWTGLLRLFSTGATWPPSTTAEMSSTGRPSGTCSAARDPLTEDIWTALKRHKIENVRKIAFISRKG